MSTANTSAAGDHGLPLNENRQALLFSCLDVSQTLKYDQKMLDHVVTPEVGTNAFYIPDQQLFSSKPSVAKLREHWTEDAVFADPIAHAHGYREYAAQWFGLQKMFPKSETLEWKVTKDEPGTLEWTQTQRYTVAGIKTQKDISSLIHVQLNSQDKITRLEDRWNSKELPKGSLAMWFRTLNGKTITPRLISVPKSDAAPAK